MNSISYLSQRVEDALHPSDLDAIIPKETQPDKSSVNIKKRRMSLMKEDSTVPFIIKIILFVPNILIVRPLAFIWFIFTFPLSLLETHSSESSETSDEPVEPIVKRSTFTKTQSSTLMELNEEDENLESTHTNDNNDTNLKSPTSPSTMGSLSHNSRLFTFPRTLYPVNLTSANFKKTLILDLDETLVHSVSRGSRNASSAYQVEIKLKNQVATLYYVQKRPYCDFFLKQVSKWFNLVIFTASVKEYADPVIDLLESEKKYFSERLYRNHCTLREGQGYIKDLSFVDKNLNHVMIVDNSPISYAMHEDNAIAVEGWISDTTDSDLLNLIPVLYSLRFTTDVRSVLSLKNGEAAFER